MFTLILLSLLTAGAPQAAEHADLLARDRALVDAFLKNDANAIQDLYAADALVMPPNATAIEGRAAIAPWAREISAVLAAFEASPIRVRVEGNMAWIAGRYTMTVKLPSGETANDTGKYLEVWRREGGTWRITADMFNSDLPAK